MAKKRGNNEGTVYQTARGTWRAQVTIQGKRISKTKKTEREALRWKRKMLDEIDDGLTYDGAQITLDKFMNDWLVTKESTLRFNTFNQYSQITRQHILPVLGKLKLRDITPSRVQQLYDQMVRYGTGLRTVELVHSVLRCSLNHALKLGIVPKNPVVATTPPKSKPDEMKFYDETQVQSLLITAEAKQDRFLALYHLALATGMRQGELLGVKWCDLDWERRLLQVQRQVTRKEGGGFEFTSPKTKAGARTLDLGESTLGILRDHQYKQQQEMKAAGNKWQDNDLIFPSSIGTLFNRDNLRKRFIRLLKDAGLPEIRFHDLRHTAAALMLNNNVPVIVASSRLGHANPSITTNVYGHLIPEKQQEVAMLMDQLLTPLQIEISI